MKMNLLNCLLLLLMGLSFPSLAQKDSVQVKKIMKRAYYFEDHNQPDSEIVYMKKAYTLSSKIGYKRGISATLAMLGVLYYNKGNFPKSIAYYYKALRYDEKTGNQQGIMRNAGNMGIIYDQLKEYDKALRQFRKALRMAEKMKLEQSASIQYSNIAIVLSHQGKQEEALYYQKKTLDIDQRLGDETFITGDLINIGVSLNQLERYDESLEYGFEALEKSRKLDDQMLIANSLNLLAEDYGDQGNFKLGEKYFLECLEAGEKIGNPDLMRGYLDGISSFYEENGRYKESLKYYKDFIVMKDSILNLNAAKESIRAEMDYEYDKKKAFTKFQSDRKIYKLNARNTLNLQLGVFLGIVLLLALVLLVFMKRAFNTKKRLADFLAAEDHRKEILLQEVHHRINNNLQIISSLLFLQANAAQDEKLYEYLTQSQNRIQSLAVLHELMYDSNSPLEINVHEYLNKILDFHRDILQNTQEQVTIETQIVPLELPTKLAVPLALIMNELVTNSIKYAFEGRDAGRILITVEPESEGSAAWIMTVSDNGKGLPPESEKRKDSLGLKLVSLMTRQLKGELDTESNGGATFKLTFLIQ
jgi:two-component system, sensor histidine kinase PdtaS